MTLSELQAENERLRAAIIRHRDYRGDDRCRLDDAELYAVLGDAPSETGELPPRDVFLAGCAKFWECRRAGVEYVSPEKAERDALAAQCESLLGDVVKVADAERERDGARAQAARLAEALTAEIHCQTCDGTGIMGGTCDACSEMGYVSKDCGFCHGTDKWEAECAECDGAKVSARSDLSIKAIASTDATQWLEGQINKRVQPIQAHNARLAEALRRLHDPDGCGDHCTNSCSHCQATAALASTDALAWLNERKVEELERLVRDHLHVESVKNLNAIWDVEYIPAYEVKRRIAELQRKGGGVDGQRN